MHQPMLSIVMMNNHIYIWILLTNTDDDFPAI